ncbi:hypothetical protein [Endozoicomonas sp. ONNA2]|uniref:hypothetical protein n=1 Tax=Endozoicomonas sp. ONNA2 TaxID=2828741 RepID=UPI0021485C83|nr:hypothetical protein [Endozoicomonas sp. ONNA2]
MVISIRCLIDEAQAGKLPGNFKDLSLITPPVARKGNPGFSDSERWQQLQHSP